MRRPAIFTFKSSARRRARRVSSAATTSALASSAASRGEASATRPIGTAASVSVPNLLAPRSHSALCPLPTEASLHIAWRSMTATKAGEPAMDPDDTGVGAPGVRAEAADDLDASRFDDPRLVSGKPAGQRLDGPDLPSGRIAALYDRLVSPMPRD